MLNTQHKLHAAAKNEAWRVYKEMLDYVGGRCFNCSRSDRRLDTDHITPLSWGGGDGPWNFQILCRTCNLSKGNRHARDWRPEPFRSRLAELADRIEGRERVPDPPPSPTTSPPSPLEDPLVVALVDELRARAERAEAEAADLRQQLAAAHEQDRAVRDLAHSSLRAQATALDGLRREVRRGRWRTR
jgi:hypothetical protein